MLKIEINCQFTRVAIGQKESYKSPTKNLAIISIQTCTENDEIKEKMKAIPVQKCIIFRLPPWRQSAKNPHKNELITTPTNAALFKRPFCDKVKLSSHSISIKGMTKPMLRVSTIVAIRHNPHVNRSSAWNLPSPKREDDLLLRCSNLLNQVSYFVFVLSSCSLQSTLWTKKRRTSYAMKFSSTCLSRTVFTVLSCIFSMENNYQNFFSRARNLK